jgi:hypothetical protein
LELGRRGVSHLTHCTGMPRTRQILYAVAITDCRFQGSGVLSGSRDPA